MTAFDEFTERHFQRWLDETEYPEYRDETESAIRRLLESHPDLLDSHGWSELRDLAGKESAHRESVQ